MAAVVVAAAAPEATLAVMAVVAVVGKQCCSRRRVARFGRVEPAEATTPSPPKELRLREAPLRAALPLQISATAAPAARCERALGAPARLRRPRRARLRCRDGAYPPEPRPARRTVGHRKSTPNHDPQS